MNPPSAGVSPPVELPSRLPHPLDDPLRFYRRLLNILLVFMFIGLFLACLLPRMGGPDWGIALYQAEMILNFVVILAVWRLLPRQAPSAIYRRSFRNDPVAYPK
jgi:hypothetical protein